MPILLTLKVRKLNMYNVTSVTPGVEARSTQMRTLWRLWHHALNIITMYVNTSMYIITLVKPCLNYNHDIQDI